MALLSRSARIIILLVLTTLFFFLELIVGYMAGSIALIADSFHMLSDILSLCVALYAIRLAKRTNYGPRYSYGWQRAEVLGALINGVFLLALCLTIVIEAIQRFVSPQPIERPQLVLGVGTAGLIVNLLGMGLFHEHGHGHGHSHSHGHDHGHEHGHSHSHGHRHGHSITSIVEDEEKAAQGGSAAAHTTAISSGTRGSSGSRQAASDVYIRQQQDDDDDEDEEYMEGHSGRQRAQAAHRNIVSGSKQLARSPEEDIAILPAQTRASMVQLATATRQKQEAMERQVSDSDSSHQDIQSAEPLSPTTAEEDTEEDEVVISMDGVHVSADTVCCPTADLATDGRTANSAPSSACDVQHGTTQRKQQKKAQKAKTGALNMQGVFLHVLGDALGSVAVIISALIIWLTDWPYRYYVDPIISLLITAMIVAFTVPLVRSTCYILLQGAPLSVPVEEVRTDILALPGVASVHELHIWQLSDTKLIASVHVLVSSDHDYMRVARRIKRLLHGYGIHSTTVQPERMPELDDNGQPILQSLQAHPRDSLVPNEQDRSEVSCLLRCADADCMPAMCCPPTESTATDTETARTRQSPHQH